MKRTKSHLLFFFLTDTTSPFKRECERTKDSCKKQMGVRLKFSWDLGTVQKGTFHRDERIPSAARIPLAQAAMIPLLVPAPSPTRYIFCFA